jgi:hypothetical protein
MKRLSGIEFEKPKSVKMKIRNIPDSNEAANGA